MESQFDLFQLINATYYGNNQDSTNPQVVALVKQFWKNQVNSPYFEEAVQKSDYYSYEIMIADWYNSVIDNCRLCALREIEECADIDDIYKQFLFLAKQETSHIDKMCYLILCDIVWDAMVDTVKSDDLNKIIFVNPIDLNLI